MRRIVPDETALPRRRVWERPSLTRLPIGETKSAGAPVDTPQPPTALQMKLGFAFEMSLPLSTRTE